MAAVAESPDVEKLGLVLPRRKSPHSGWPSDAPTLGVGGESEDVGPADVGFGPSHGLGHRSGHPQHQGSQHDPLEVVGDRRLSLVAKR